MLNSCRYLHIVGVFVRLLTRHWSPKRVEWIPQSTLLIYCRNSHGTNRNKLNLRMYGCESICRSINYSWRSSQLLRTYLTDWPYCLLYCVGSSVSVIFRWQKSIECIWIEQILPGSPPLHPPLNLSWLGQIKQVELKARERQRATWAK